MLSKQENLDQLVQKQSDVEHASEGDHSFADYLPFPKLFDRLDQVMDFNSDRFQTNLANLKIIGHRGGYQPENSMTSFEQAVSNNIDAIELDLWASSDNIPMILHGSLDGRIEHESPEMKAMGISAANFVRDVEANVLSMVPIGGGQTIPSFEQVLQKHGSSTKIYVDIKQETREFCKPIVDLVLKYDALDNCIFSCYSKEVLDEISKLTDEKAHLNHIYIYWLTDKLPDPSEYTQLGEYVTLNCAHLTQEVVDQCHAHGQKVAVFFTTDFVEQEYFYNYITYLGADGIISDIPDRLLKYKQDHSVVMEQPSIEKPFAKFGIAEKKERTYSEGDMIESGEAESN